MANSKIFNKVWQIATVLRDAGVSNSDYLEQITFLLFLKMVDENKHLPTIFQWKNIEFPEECKWELLLSKSGEDLKDYYEKILNLLSKQTGMIGEIYRGAKNSISEPTQLRKVISMINSVKWSSLSEDVKGDIYESLLERIAQDTKSGAGQYFTPRALIKAIVKCVNPQLGKTIVDPCCGSGGFLLAAKTFLEQQNPTGEQEKKLKNGTFFGNEIVPNTYRLCLMNLLLHGIGEFGDVPPIKCKDSLSSQPNSDEFCDYVMTNPPFGTKSSTKFEVTEKDKKTGEEITKLKTEHANYVRTDFIVNTSNKQLNFIQHIKSLLKVGGTAAVVLPDNVLFEGNAGEIIRKNLLKTCDLHTILRLPTGIFYAKGVKPNVLFFEKRPTAEINQTKEIWFYDYRTNIKHTLIKNPLVESDFDDFVSCYRPNDRYHRVETYDAETNPNGRWRKFTYDEIINRDKTSLDITWMKKDDTQEDLSLAELMSSIQEESNNISNAVAELQKLLANIEEE